MNNKLIPAAFFLSLLAASLGVSQAASPEATATAQTQPFKSADFEEIPNLLQIHASRNAPEEEKAAAKASNDILTKFDNEIQESSKAAFRGERPKHKFYVYTVKKDDLTGGKGFAQIAAHLNQKHSTLATLNRLENPGDIRAGDKLIVSVVQGLFLRENPANSLEILLSQTYTKEITQETEKITIDGSTFYFLPKITYETRSGPRLTEANFYGTILYFFHDNGMVLPLNKKVVTSPFGYRTSPISGQWKMHNGIDLASPIGSEVFATKSGTVAETGFNSVYGNYIIINHSGTKSSLYAHLSKINVEKNARVSTGQTIGLVGTTGMSTGPHLHFEIHEGGSPKDPTAYLKK